MLGGTSITLTNLDDDVRGVAAPPPKEGVRGEELPVPVTPAIAGKQPRPNVLRVQLRRK
jgi:hypothetical protein